jgi:hypothetical protein
MFIKQFASGVQGQGVIVIGLRRGGEGGLQCVKIAAYFILCLVNLGAVWTIIKQR